jgi:hypothetical protein
MIKRIFYPQITQITQIGNVSIDTQPYLTSTQRFDSQMSIFQIGNDGCDAETHLLNLRNLCNLRIIL